MSLILTGVRVAVLDPVVVRPDTTVGVLPRVAATCGMGGGLYPFPAELSADAFHVPGVHAAGKEDRWIGVCVRM